jgi:type I restriction enzyme S subunit
VYAFPWEQRKFSDVFVGLQNNTLSRADLNYDQGDIKNVHYGDVLIKFGEYIDVASAELPYINDSSIESKFVKSLLADGDIIIADTAEDETVGKCCEITNSDSIKLLSGLHTIAVRPQQKYASKFLGYYLNSSAYHSQLIPLMQGIKVTSISKGALQDTVLTVPTSIDEQGKIGECLSNIDDIITLHQRNN